MNNASVNSLLLGCANELAAIETLVDGLGIGSSIVPYLSRYGVIKACGTIEQAFKSIVADKCSFRGKPQVKRFLRRKIRESSTNPSYSAICSVLHDFDENWKNDFKKAIDSDSRGVALKTSLQSLVDARNEFAHGGSPHVSIADVIQYYSDARLVIEKLDAIVG